MDQRLSLPKEFTDQIINALQDNASLFFESLDSIPPVSIRVNTLKNKKKYPDRIPWTDSGFYLEQRPVFTLDPLFHAGNYYVQEASSMFLEQAIKNHVDTTQPLHILDLCAAPGGKSTHLLSLVNDESLLVSNEVIQSRAQILRENVIKWGKSNVVVTNNDPKDFQSLEGFFDVIVVDAPCSGEGLFRKDPEAIREWSPGNVQLCSKRQQRILNDVWPALKTNGLLIYCTCTYNPIENEENLSWMSEQHDFDSLTIPLRPDWGIEEVSHKKIKGYRFYPHRVKGEGFFISVIKKKETQETQKHRIKNKLECPLRKIHEQLRPWINQHDQHDYFLFKDTVYVVPVGKTEDVSILARYLRIVSAGTGIASIKHDKLIPEHSLAMAIHFNAEQFNMIDVPLEEALQYLRKEPVHFQDSDKGFTLIRYENSPLGWINALGNRSNNLYPKEWRIRTL